MARLAIGDRVLETRFALPAADTAGALRSALPGLGVARARVAAQLGRPDPFALREALAALPAETPVQVSGEGEPWSRDAVDLALFDAATRADQLAAVFADGVPAQVRQRGFLDADDPRGPALRYRKPQVPPHRLGKPTWHDNASLDQPDIATARCLYTLPDGRLAAGGDYGMALYDGRRWTPFPYPAGARREARRVEAMAMVDGELLVASQKSWFSWDGDPTHEAAGRNLRRDSLGGHDDVRIMRAFDGALHVGWRLGYEGGEGLPETLSLARDPAGCLWAGTLHGELYLVGHAEPLKVFADTKPRPVRYMAWALGHLWVAATGQLHRFDGFTWSATPGEPGALSQGPYGRLWAIRQGKVWVSTGGWPRPLELPVQRPWSLGFAHDCLYVGCIGGVLQVPLTP